MPTKCQASGHATSTMRMDAAPRVGRQALKLRRLYERLCNLVQTAKTPDWVLPRASFPSPRRRGQTTLTHGSPRYTDIEKTSRGRRLARAGREKEPLSWQTAAEGSPVPHRLKPLVPKGAEWRDRWQRPGGGGPHSTDHGQGAAVVLDGGLPQPCTGGEPGGMPGDPAPRGGTSARGETQTPHLGRLPAGGATGGHQKVREGIQRRKRARREGRTPRGDRLNTSTLSNGRIFAAPAERLDSLTSTEITSSPATNGNR